MVACTFLVTIEAPGNSHAARRCGIYDALFALSGVPTLLRQAPIFNSFLLLPFAGLSFFVIFLRTRSVSITVTFAVLCN